MVNELKKLSHYPTTKAVIERMGGVTRTARYFGISRTAVYLWERDEPILKERFYELWYRNPELFTDKPEAD